MTDPSAADLPSAAQPSEPMPEAARLRAELATTRTKLLDVTSRLHQHREVMGKMADLVNRLELVAAPTIRRRFPVAAELLTELAALKD